MFKPFAVALALLALSSSKAAASPDASDAVFLVGSIHRLHEREEAFTYADLRRILKAARPDLLVLEVRPDELAERKETPGRPEYPAVVWPYLVETGVPAVPMEPGGAEFQRMAGAAEARFKALQAERPADAAYLASLGRSLSAALTAHWRSPADAHDQVTADLMRADALAEARLAGEAFARGQAEWDGYMTERARAAVRANPGKRILILASYRNLAAFRAALKDEPRLVEPETWIRKTLGR